MNPAKDQWWSDQTQALSELEKQIQTNGHLPGIPSAKQVNEDGLHPGEMQRRMVEKIEQLTLYVIQLQKEIDVLKKRN